jgi:hypothetical protein
MDVLRRLRDRPHWLEVAYQFTENLFQRLNPLMQKIGYERADRILHTPEKISKQAVFDCKMCGQCTLHFTGMTCPMGCPKNLRNGPCGGVRADKSCEVDASMKCVWVEAYERSTKMNIYGDGIFNIQPPLNHRLAGKSAFINILSLQGADMPEAWNSKTGIVYDRE